MNNINQETLYKLGFGHPQEMLFHQQKKKKVKYLGAAEELQMKQAKKKKETMDMKDFANLKK